MTFSAQVKQELCRRAPENDCCALAEVYGALMLGQSFEEHEVRVVTTHVDFAHRLAALLARCFGLDLKPRRSASNHWDVTLRDASAIVRIMESFGYGRREVALHLNNALLCEDCCPAAFWRGAFLSGGSITDPGKTYHLEMVTPRLPLSRELMTLMLECDLTPHLTTRGGVQVLYFKASESIEDFLTLIGAPVSALSLMETKVEKDLRNLVNRKVNCETGNVTRTVDAAARATEAILQLMSSPSWDKLSEPLRHTARVRLENPEESLSELAERLSIGKSALNHRLRKIIALAGDSSSGAAK